MPRRLVLAVSLLLFPVVDAHAQRPEIVFAATPRATSVVSRDACESSYQRGALVARDSHSTKGWRAGGFASGLLFSFVGVAGATVVASTAPAVPDTVPERELSRCYRDGYRSIARSRSRGTAFRSALVGATILPLVYVVRLSTR
jgi:hypothetical protein